MKTINRDAARVAGLKRYYTGVPCTQGHVAERYTADGKCVTCISQKNKRHRDSGVYQDKFGKEYAQSWRDNNRDRCSDYYILQNSKPGRREKQKYYNQKNYIDYYHNKKGKLDARSAVKALTELTGVPHEVVEIIGENGKKSFEVRRVEEK